ncbi:hypothetical protein A3849_13760 [Paenibacillus sp. P46E]|nr:hypothetical protein A3849_13760 [Paenibacillus sp. P46E]
MRVQITETNEIKELTLIDPKTGVDYVQDFIGNYDALADGQFTWNEGAGAFLAEQDTFSWWSQVIEDQKALDERIAELKESHDSEDVDAVVNAAADVDLENLAASVNKALDEEFGVTEGK